MKFHNCHHANHDDDDSIIIMIGVVTIGEFHSEKGFWHDIEYVADFFF